MKLVQKKSPALIATLLVISAFIGPADALGPQTQLLATSTTAITAGMTASPASQTEIEPPLNAETEAPLLPVRPTHEGVATDLFSGHSWYTPPPPAPVVVRSKPEPRTPTAPPLPFSLIGSFEQEGAATLYYLVRDDRVYDVKIGDVIDDMYRVDSVTNGQLLFYYLPLNASQGLRLGDN